MADNLCGPSNALQSFQKHSSVDRTLQQDRFITRKPSSQGFRSSPGPNAGLLDPEFEAFQAGQLPLDPHQAAFQQYSHTPPPHLQQPIAGPSAWANDFQRLNISTPPPQLQSLQRSPLHQGQDGGAWHQDFRQQFQMEQQGMSQPQMQQGMGSQFSPMMSGGMGMRAGMQPQFMGGMANSQLQQEPQQPVEAFDDAAFAQAFDDAAKAEMAKEAEAQSQDQDISQATQEIQLDETAERFMSASPVQEAHTPIPGQALIGADLIHNPSDSPQQQPEDPDALARTAGQLLESVRNNTSQKFQNSEFLQLMRQFRDREVQVEGDKIVERATGMNSAMGLEEGLGGGGIPESIQVQPLQP